MGDRKRNGNFSLQTEKHSHKMHSVATLIASAKGRFFERKDTSPVKSSEKSSLYTNIVDDIIFDVSLCCYDGITSHVVRLYDIPKEIDCLETLCRKVKKRTSTKDVHQGYKVTVQVVAKNVLEKRTHSHQIRLVISP